MELTTLPEQKIFCNKIRNFFVKAMEARKFQTSLAGTIWGGIIADEDPHLMIFLRTKIDNFIYLYCFWEKND